MAESARSPTKQQLEASALYRGLLEEAKIRISAIESAVNGAFGLHPALVREFCYLQLRMLCELVALGCLTAHGEIKATQAAALQNEYAAGRIVAQLQKLHSNFYPHAIRLTVSADHVHFDRLESGFLTKSELIELYGKCGDRLHRGSLKKLLAGAKKMQDPNFSDIVAWTNKIIRLLEQHHIASFDNLSHFICVLKQEPTGGAVVAIALSPLPK